MKEAVRAHTLETFRARALEVVRAHPEIKSLLLAVAQYWADEADDAVHVHLVASQRDTPVWPHECSGYGDDGPPNPIAGEICEYCAHSTLDYLRFHDNGESNITAFAPYCIEYANQEQPTSEAYTPFAIARGNTWGVEIERVGTLHRPQLELLDEPVRAAAGESARELDPRARELLEIACAPDAELGARRVLADYLLEHEDPRGEYLSLALATELDEAGAARRDALLERHRWSWIHPLAHAIPEGCARFERGLLVEATEVFVDDAAEAIVLGAPAWASVERLRYAPENHGSVLHPVMTALREVGPVSFVGLETIATATRPWAIESLHAVLGPGVEYADSIEFLASSVTLPRLRRLAIQGARPLARLVTAPWWTQLERLTWVGPFDDDVAPAWLGRADPLLADVPWVAIVEHRDGRPAGWEIVASRERVEVAMVGWHPTATRDRLIQILASLPETPTALVPSQYWEPTATDAATIAGETRRAVSLARSRTARSAPPM